MSVCAPADWKRDIVSSQGPPDDFRAANSERPGRDTDELSLSDILGNHLGREHSDSYSFTFHALGGKDVYRIHVRPASKPVYHNGPRRQQEEQAEGERGGGVRHGSLGLGGGPKRACAFLPVLTWRGGVWHDL
jgi:hypothetical protein